MQPVSLRTDPEFDGSLTFSRAPDGELDFEDGVAEVPDDVDVDWLVDRYPNLVAGDNPEPKDTGDDSDSSDEEPASESEPEPEPEEEPEPDEDEEDPLADADYSDLQQMAGEYDDIKGNQSAEDLRAALREKREED